MKYHFKLIKQNPRHHLLSNDITLLKLSIKTMKRIIVFIPWVKNCYVKAFTFNYILINVGIKSELILGIQKKYDKIQAHAYLRLNNIDRTYFFNRNYCDIFNFDLYANELYRL
jgi:hypothetical protein